MPPEEPCTRSADRGLGAEADPLADIGQLERRIEEGETQLTKVRNQRAATLVVLMGGSVSLIFLGSRWFLDKGLFGVTPAVAALLLFAGLNAWRISRDNKRERELEAALEEYRDKKAQLDRSLKDEE